ncbi:glycoside hydrolase family 130 protein [Planctomycetota bacterium]
MKVFRSPDNAIIEPGDVSPSKEGFEVIGVFNAGAARLGQEVVLLLRVAERPVSEHPEIVLAAVYDVTLGGIVLKEFLKSDTKNDFSDPRLIVRADETYLTSISHLRVARSKDGINFEVEDGISFGPASEVEAFGVEDPRISFIDGVYYISYVAVSALGVTTALASTKDFKTFERGGVIYCPDNKDVAIFPERINGRFYALHRPASSLFGKNQMWIAESPDLTSWGKHRYLMDIRYGLWDELKIGAGAVPVKTERGWVEVYHGADRNNRYCLGAVLLDLKEPWKVTARGKEPILEPEADYERRGFFGEVVFSCGLLSEEGKLKIYYGACDTSICYAELDLDEVLDSLK